MFLCNTSFRMKPLLCIFGVFTPFFFWAQEPAEPLERELESVAAANEDVKIDLVQLAEEFMTLRENPMKVNFATQEELSSIPGLNVFQINNLLQYRSRTGALYTPYELLQVKGFDRALIEQIVPYLSFTTHLEFPKVTLAQWWHYSRHEVVLRSGLTLEKRAGFKQEGGFNGPPGNHYLRYKGRYRDLFQWGFTTQQDPGEPFGAGQPLGVDFLSGHLAVRNFGRLRRFVLGDYQLEFGQGLALWTSLAFGKSAKAVGIKRFAGGVKPFSGSEENRFMRGAAFSYRVGQFDVSMFYSGNHIDAHLAADETSAISSLPTSGLHRTSTELADKDANLLRSLGGNVNYKGNGFSIGATVVQHQLNKSLVLKDELYRKYQLQGKQFANYAIDVNRLWRNFNLYGEFAVNEHGVPAFFAGLESNLADNFMFTLAGRKFSKGYSALYNAPFAETGKSGEGGVYLGVDWQIWKRLRLTAYADHYTFSWPRFRVNTPSRGSEYLMQFTHGLNRYTQYYLRYKIDVQQVNMPEGILPVLMPRRSQKLRIHFTYSPYSNWSLASRLEYAWFNTLVKAARGFMFFQDVGYTFSQFPFSLKGRIAIVESPDFDTRLYAYEHDVLYAFSIPAYYGQSMRFYLLGSCELSKGVRIQLRYSRTDFFDRMFISSGLQEIAGNRQSELKVMLKVRF